MLGLTPKPGEALALVERCGGIVDGMDYDNSNPHGFPDNQNSSERRRDQNAAQSPPLTSGVESETTDQYRGNRLVGAKVLVAIPAPRLPFAQREAAESVVPDNATARAYFGETDENIGGGGVVVLIPYHRMVDGVIETGSTAREGRHIVSTSVKAFDDRWDGLVPPFASRSAHTGEPCSRQRAMERSIASFGGGGLAIASNSASMSWSLSSR